MTSRYSSWRAQSVTESGRTLARIDTWTYSPKIVTALPDVPVVHFCLSQRTQFYRFDSKWPNEEVDICLGESYMHPDIKQKKKSTQGRGVKSSLATEDAGLIGRRRKTVEKKKIVFRDFWRRCDTFWTSHCLETIQAQVPPKFNKVWLQGVFHLPDDLA